MSAGNWRAPLAGLLLGLLPGWCLAQSATADSYSQMLGYLTHSRLEGQVLAGASGSIKLNQAAGDLNRQYNGHALASGEQASVQVAVAPRSNDDQLATGTALQARAELTGQVLQGASGLASLNQASGQANGQANAVAISVSAQAAPGAPAMLAPLPRPAGTSDRRPVAVGVRQALITGQALAGYAGVLQLNQIAGSFNVVENRLGLHVQTGP